MKCCTHAKLALLHRRHAVDPPLVLLQKVATPVAVVERRVRQHPIRLQVRETVVVKGVAVGDLSVNPRIARFILARRQVV